MVHLWRRGVHLEEGLRIDGEKWSGGHEMCHEGHALGAQDPAGSPSGEHKRVMCGGVHSLVKPPSTARVLSRSSRRSVEETHF